MNPDSVQDIKNSFQVVYKYFSHNIRTSTATIVAMLEALKDGLGDDADEMMSMITESGFLLDLFDRGLSSCSNYILSGEISGVQDRINLHRLVNRFLDEVTYFQDTGAERPEIDIPDDFEVDDTSYIFKTLFQIILFEASKTCADCMKISLRQGQLSVRCANLFTENPEILKLFIEMFTAVGIEAGYDGEIYNMRFDK